MRVHVLQHVASEGLGSIESWLASVGAQVTWTCFFESTATLPSAQDCDLVIALGGPMSVNDEDALPWLRAEKRFIRDAMDSGKAVLGICLGSQLIASALGARVYPNMHKEIGWFPVTAVAQGEDVFGFPASVDVFHWHGETVELPPGAVHIARSVACEHQAFQIGHNIIGLQFHLETTPVSAQAFVDADHAEPLEKRELVAGQPYVQSAQQILTAPASCYAGINALMVDVLAYLVRGMPSGS